MTSKLKYIHRFTDRHGKVRYYFRRPGQKRIPLPGVPESMEFMEAYRAALAGEPLRQTQREANRLPSGTVRAVVNDYYQSTLFRKDAEATRRWRRTELERFCAGYGDLPIALLEYKHIDAIVAQNIDKPGACDAFVRVLRGLFKYCRKTGIRRDDPTRGIELPPMDPDGIRTWTEDEIAIFEAAYPIGTLERLAFTLALYTGLRREDLVALGPGHIITRGRDGKKIVRFRPEKTKMSTGVYLEIPVLPALARVLETIPNDAEVFLTTKRSRKPFKLAYFTNWFIQACRRAGLPEGLSIHGLRKALCRRMAEAGCTVNEIMAVSGHTTLACVQIYTKKAERPRMAVTAMDNVLRVFGGEGENDGANLVNFGLPIEPATA
jgi:integrase